MKDAGEGRSSAMPQPPTHGHAQHVFGSSFTASVPTATTARLNLKFSNPLVLTTRLPACKISAPTSPCHRHICWLAHPIRPRCTQNPAVTLSLPACTSLCSTQTTPQSLLACTTPLCHHLLESSTTRILHNHLNRMRRHMPSLPPRRCNRETVLTRLLNLTLKTSTASRISPSY